MDPRLGRRLGAVVLAGVIVGAGAIGLVRAQEADNSVAPAAPEETAPVVAPAPENSATEQVTAPANVTTMAPILDIPKGPVQKPEQKAEAPLKPAQPPIPVRSPVAVLQALDKVTAETIRFAAPVGRKVRYKNLVFTVRACETRDLDAPEPKAAAYLVIDSAPPGAPGREPPPAKQIYKGWMFASSPDLHPVEHPIYDAWLIACSAASPPA